SNARRAAGSARFTGRMRGPREPSPIPRLRRTCPASPCCSIRRPPGACSPASRPTAPNPASPSCVVLAMGSRPSSAPSSRRAIRRCRSGSCNRLLFLGEAEILQDKAQLLVLAGEEFARCRAVEIAIADLLPGELILPCREPGGLREDLVPIGDLRRRQ